MKTKILFYLLFFHIGHYSYSQAIVKSKLDELIKVSEAKHSSALIIYENNNLVCEQYASKGQFRKQIEAMSATKSIVGIAVACLLDDGLLNSLDVPVYKFYPEWKQGKKKNITIRHLVNMTSGIQNVLMAPEEIYPAPDFVQLALTAELTDDPGTKFSYNNKSVNLLAGIIEKITGKRMDIYIGSRIFKPLGILDYKWELDSKGNPHAMSGCSIKPIDFVKIGILLLNKGKYNDRVVVSEKYLKRVVEPCEIFGEYGMLWWLKYEQSVSIVNDSTLAPLIKGTIPDSTKQKLLNMKGRYSTDADFEKKAFEILGDYAWRYTQDFLPETTSIRRKELKGIISYKAAGYLGNYIIVDPVNNIVALRMIDGDDYQTENDGFFNFENLVLGLTKK
ncbi:MAG: serine hydrolase domain-containing protein [Sphingobacteriaceae bacterium]